MTPGSSRLSPRRGRRSAQTQTTPRRRRERGSRADRTLVKYLSLSALVPAGVALFYREPLWPFLAAAAIGFVVGLGLERLGAHSAAVGFREGYLVVALTWLLAAGLRRDSVSPLRRPAARPPGQRVLRVDVRLHDDRVVDPDERRGGRPLAPPLAAAHAVGRRHGDHRPRRRDPATAAGRRPPTPRIGDARAPRPTRSPSGSCRRRGGCGCSTSHSASSSPAC